MQTRSLFLALLCASLPYSAWADQRVDDLKRELQTAAKAKPRDPSNRDASTCQQLAAQLAAAAFGQGDEQVVIVIKQIESSAPNEKIQQMARTLLPQLAKERQDREDAKTAEITASVTAALRAGLEAKTAQDLDGPLASLNKLEEGSERSPRLQRLSSQAQQALDFLRQLQDLLIEAPEAGGTNKGQRLRSFSAAPYDFTPFVPRSEFMGKLLAIQKNYEPKVVERAPNPEVAGREAQEIMSKEKSLDDLTAAVQRLEALQRTGGLHDFGDLSLLRSLSAAYQDLKLGLGTSITLIPLTTARSSTENESTEALRAQLLKFALPRVLLLPDADGPKPDESAASYLQRMQQVALAQKDWLLLGRVVEMNQRLNLSGTRGAFDTMALTQFLAGLNQERAHQTAFAVASYLAALKSGSQAVPAEHIGERLEALKRAQPDQYETGVKYALTPPPVSDDASANRPRYGPPNSYYGNPPRNFTIPPGAAPQPGSSPEKLLVPPPVAVPPPSQAAAPEAEPPAPPSRTLPPAPGASSAPAAPPASAAPEKAPESPAPGK